MPSHTSGRVAILDLTDLVKPETIAAVLEKTAERWMSRDADQYEASTIVQAWAHPSLTKEEAWTRFAEFARLAKLRDDVNAGLVAWREVEPALTCIDPSVEAYQIACRWAEDALRALIGGAE